MDYRVSDQVWLGKFKELERWRENHHEKAVRVGKPAYRECLASVNIPPGSRLLDVGCAGGIMRECLPAGVDYQGIDPFPKAKAPCIFKARAEEIPFGGETFDYVTCFATLFHLQDLGLSFKEMTRVLKPAGMLLALVIIKGENDPPGKSHTFRITHEMIDELVEMAGLTWVFKREIPEFRSWLCGWKK